MDESRVGEGEISAGARPVVGFLKRSVAGEPFLEGHRCADCAAVFLALRSVCGRCGKTGEIAPFRLSETGHLYVYSIVHRSLPGVPVPFISAIVDLEGGGTLKGNLIGVEPDPAEIPMGMAVELVFGDASGRTDPGGAPYLSYFFRPRS